MCCDRQSFIVDEYTVQKTNLYQISAVSMNVTETGNLKCHILNEVGDSSDEYVVLATGKNGRFRSLTSLSPVRTKTRILRTF